MNTKLSQPDRDDDGKKRILKPMAGRAKKDNMTDVIEDLLEDHRRRQFFEDLNKGYKQLEEDIKNDPELRKQVEEEQRLWDSTLMDGLEDE